MIQQLAQLVRLHNNYLAYSTPLHVCYLKFHQQRFPYVYVNMWKLLTNAEHESPFLTIFIIIAQTSTSRVKIEPETVPKWKKAHM